MDVYSSQRSIDDKIDFGIDSDCTDVAEDILEVVNEYLYNVAIKIKTDKGFKIRKPVVKFQITRK